MRIKIAYTLVQALVVLSSAFSQGFTYKRFTVKDGLPSNEVSNIMQDKDGFVWFTSQDNLVKYDGLKFQCITDKTFDGYSLFGSDVTYVKDLDKFLFLNGANLVEAKYSFEYHKLDSSLIFWYDPDKEANRIFDVGINKKGYTVFSRDLCKKRYCTTNTLYFCYNNKVQHIDFPKGYERIEESRFLIQDRDKNIYIKLKESKADQIAIFLFEEGKLVKLFSHSANEFTDRKPVKIVEDKKGRHWYYSDSLICLFDKGKQIKSFEYKDVKNTLLSDPVIDSKNNLWISSEKCLLKFSDSGFQIHEDRNRRPKITMDYSFDAQGRQFINRETNYITFFSTNAIDKYDNIFNGYRMFDGHIFSDLAMRSSEFKNDFWRSGKDLSNDNSISPALVFVDDQENVWFGGNYGLMLSSPAPFKALDEEFSYQHQGYQFVLRDKKGREYFKKAIQDSGLIRIKVVDEGVIIDHKFNASKKYELGYVHQFQEGAVLLYCDRADKFSFTSLEKTPVELFQSPIVYYYKANYNDTLIYYNESGFVVGTSKKWYAIDYDVSNDPFFTFQNKMVTSDLRYYRILGDKIEMGTFIESAGKEEVNKNDVGILWDPLVPKNDTVFIYNLRGKIFRKTKNEEVVFEFPTTDTLEKKCRNDKGWGFLRMAVFKDLILFTTNRNGIVIYKMNLVTKKLEFVGNLNYANGCPGKAQYYMAVEGDYVSVWAEYPNNFRVWKYNDIVTCNFSKFVKFDDFYLNFYDVHKTINEYGQREINNQISYIGERGINLIPPPVKFYEISYLSNDGLLHSINGNSNDVKIDYDFTMLYLEFKGICLVEGEKLKYKTKLVGLNNDWSETDAEFAYVRYPALSPGSYTFMVTACNNHGVWNEKPISFSFEILPPWYRTWLAYLAYVTLGGLSIYVFVRSRTKKLKKEKEKLETIVEERTKEAVEQKEIAEHQKHIVEEKQKEILDSINYAKRIQYTLLAHKDFLAENIPDHFVYFNPKDIVSGDFYWAAKKGNKFYLAVCDSTGHGVPGAFMSLLNISFLNEAISEKGFEQPNEVFDFVRQRLIDNISKEGQKDGFDGIMVCFDRSSNKLTYASANNAPVLIQNGSIVELESDRMPVGKGEKEDLFKLREIKFNKGDILYLYTDGFPDQFGGPRGKKYMYKRLNENLLNLSKNDLHDQMKELKSTFENWKGELEQVDDVCIIGIRL